MASVNVSKAATDQSATADPVGMHIEQRFCPQGVTDPFETVEWETRSAEIKDESGNLLFEQTGCEIPVSWSQLATNVVVSKYFYGENGTEEREGEGDVRDHVRGREWIECGRRSRFSEGP